MDSSVAPAEILFVFPAVVFQEKARVISAHDPYARSTFPGIFDR